MNKAEIRERLIELRRDMTEDEVVARSAEVLETLKSAIDWSVVRSAHVYRSVDSWNEVRTVGVIRWLKSEHPDMSVTVGESSRSAPAPETDFDVILVPLLAFDASLNRLGFGGGWYDRFLASQSGALKVGLAYGLQRVDTINVQPHDIPLDMVLTDSGAVTK